MCALPERGSLADMSEIRELSRDLTETSRRELTERFRGDVFVRSPRRGGLTKVLTGMGATVLAEIGGGLSVTGIESWRIASVAAEHHIPIQELTPRRTPPEEAYRRPER